MNLLTTTNAKTQKGIDAGYITGILYLAPHTQSGIINVCPYASPGCSNACLYTAGHGRFEQVKAARIRKTNLFAKDSAYFVGLLIEDINALIRKGKRESLIPVIRLNGTSDIPWEKIKSYSGRALMELFPQIQFYDYTKRPNRVTIYENYHLTFSRSEINEEQCLNELAIGRNVAVVFNTKKNKPLPKFWGGYEIWDGDQTDLRFLDPEPLVIGLRGKGKAKQDNSGFTTIGD